MYFKWRLSIKMIKANMATNPININKNKKEVIYLFIIKHPSILFSTLLELKTRIWRFSEKKHSEIFVTTCEVFALKKTGDNQGLFYFYFLIYRF